MPTKDEESELTLKELESLPWGKNYEKDPVNRELPSREAAEWLECNGFQLPDELEPGPPLDADKRPWAGRLARDWRPEQAPDGGPPEPAKKKWRPRVVLPGSGERPLVDGKEKDRLTIAQYDVIRALLKAGESGLDKARSIENSGHGGGVKVLKNLAQQDSDWKSVILLPGRRGGRYRLASV